VPAQVNDFFEEHLAFALKENSLLDDERKYQELGKQIEKTKKELLNMARSLQNKVSSNISKVLAWDSTVPSQSKKVSVISL
jgi:hypothetical protein